jgi:hypothetical protein
MALTVAKAKGPATAAPVVATKPNERMVAANKTQVGGKIARAITVTRAAAATIESQLFLKKPEKLDEALPKNLKNLPIL